MRTGDMNTSVMTDMVVRRMLVGEEVEQVLSDQSIRCYPGAFATVSDEFLEHPDIRVLGFGRGAIEGVVLYIRRSNDWWEVHVAILKGSRGKYAVKGVRATHAFMKIKEGATKFVAYAPRGRPDVRHFAVSVGYKSTGLYSHELTHSLMCLKLR